MLKDHELEKRLWRVRWPAIAFVVVLVLAVIQAIRVNQPPPPSSEPAQLVKYAGKGPLLTGEIAIAPNSFHATRIDLNRRAKLSGTYRTPNTKQTVSVIVLDETNFENWKAQQNYQALVETGFVPGGKISPVIGPGTFFLVLDNRTNSNSQLVTMDVGLE